MKLMYVLSEYPAVTETFIDREIKELRKYMDIEVFSLKKPASAAGSIYLPFFLSSEVIRANITHLIRSPATHMKLLLRAVWMNRGSALDIARTLAVFPKSVCIGMRIRHGKPAAGHVHAGWATIPAMSAYIISRVAGLDFSFSAHAWDIYKGNPSLVQKISSSRFVVTCTAYNKRYLDKMTGNRFRDKIYRVYHGLDLSIADDFRKKETDVPVILSIGSLRKKKGMLYLLEACGILRDENCEFRCIIIGEGPEKRALSGFVKSRGLGASVEFVGYQAFGKILDHFSMARLFVLPSVISDDGDRDGIPNVILEAMLLKVPVIATGISGIPEAVTDGETGLLVREKDPAALAKCIRRLLSDEKLQEKLTANAYAKVGKDFDIRKNISGLVRLFEKK